MNTTDYKKFSRFNWNRAIDEKWVNKIADSMKDFGWVGTPIYVDSQFRIWDGQHRCAAAEIAQIPVEYIINDDWTPATVATVNSTTHTWNLMTYVQMYASLGNQDYVRFANLCKTYNINCDKVFRIVNKQLTSNNISTIKDGSLTLTMNEYKMADHKLSQIAKIINAFRSGSNNVKFTACVFIVEHYSDTVVEKLRDCLSKADQDNINFENTQILLYSIEKIYNKRKRLEDHVYFSDDYKRTTNAKATATRREKYYGNYQSKKSQRMFKQMELDHASD